MHSAIGGCISCRNYARKAFAEQLAIDSYLAVELMVLLIVGRRLKTSPCSGLVKVGMLLKQAPIEVAIGIVSA
jgi:hypothetical protein